jgi:hypothetical protein
MKRIVVALLLLLPTCAVAQQAPGFGITPPAVSPPAPCTPVPSCPPEMREILIQQVRWAKIRLGTGTSQAAGGRPTGVGKCYTAASILSLHDLLTLFAITWPR